MPTEHYDHNTNTHKQQYAAENRVETADEFIDRKHRRERIISEDDQYPYDGNHMAAKLHGLEPRKALEQGRRPA